MSDFGSEEPGLGHINAKYHDIIKSNIDIYFSLGVSLNDGKVFCLEEQQEFEPIMKKLEQRFHQTSENSL